ncbi:unnamed protein product [Heterobilharzia americana]|nr:unnamed protein product [Heterobilharzia americana]
MSNVLSHKLEDLKTKTNKLAKEARQRRRDFLQVNVEKTQVMKIPNQQQQQKESITINGRNLQELVPFTYLDSQHRSNYRRHRRGCQSHIGKDSETVVHQCETSVEICCSALSLKREQDPDFQD